MPALRTTTRLSVPLLLGALTLAAPASAQQSSEPAEDGANDEAVPDGGTPERGRARALASEGMDLIRSGETERGIAKLEEALDLVPVPTIALATADAMVKVGRYVDALATYRRAASMEIPDWITTLARMKQQLAKDKASRKIPPMLEKMPKVRLTIIGEEPETVTIDGEAQDLAALNEELFVDPGVHVFEAKSGTMTTTQNVTVPLGGAIAVTLKLDGSAETVSDPVVPPPAPTPTPDEPVGPIEASSAGTTMTIFGWVAVGLGGAALGAMAGTWVVASGLASDLEPGCNDGVCDPTAIGQNGVDDLDSYNTLRTTTIILGVAGGVLAATGVTLLLTAPSSGEPSSGGPSSGGPSSGEPRTGEGSPEVALDLGPLHAGVHGRF